MKWKTWLLAVSVGLNVMLLAGLVTGPLLTEAAAQNRATNAAGGGYVLVAARTGTSRQSLWVVDTRVKRLIVYGPASAGRGALKVVDARDLARDFGADFTGDCLMLPFELSDAWEGVAVVDTVGRRMITYVSTNFSKLEIIDSRNLGTDFGAK